MSRRQLRLTRTLIALALLTLVVIRVAHVVGARADADPPARSTPTSPTSPGPAVTRSSAQPAARGTGAARTTYANDSWLPAARGPGHLASGSDPSALPGPILIADKKNNRLVIVDPQGRLRWVFPRPGDLSAGQTFRIPDDAFFSPDGKEIIATQEDDFVVSVIDIATHRIVYRYGHPGVAGGTANHLNNPDDAMLLPDGTIVLADIRTVASSR